MTKIDRASVADIPMRVPRTATMNGSPLLHSRSGQSAVNPSEPRWRRVGFQDADSPTGVMASKSAFFT